jgi:hypothetical protein
VSLTDRGDIRYNPALEPLGALGDLGWYCMRATREYLSPESELRSVEVSLRRDSETGAVVSGEGLLTFLDHTVSRWSCAFDAEKTDIGLALSGSHGTIRMDNFVGEAPDGTANYHVESTDAAGAAGQVIAVASGASGPALMFDDFSKMAHARAPREPWICASERTQALLDAAWATAMR